MKNLLKKSAKKFNSKKGFTLVELIVGIMIMLVVVSASVRGITISYRSALLGAAKNDAQSIAQRNCDIIMTAIVTNVENTTFTASNIGTLGDMFTDTNCDNFTATYQDAFSNDDMSMHLPEGGYDRYQYALAQQVVGDAAAVESRQRTDHLAALATPSTGDDNQKYQYYTVSMSTKSIGSNYKVFHVTTYVYYTDKGYVTCEGEVSVLPKT